MVPVRLLAGMDRARTMLDGKAAEAALVARSLRKARRSLLMGHSPFRSAGFRLRGSVVRLSCEDVTNELQFDDSANRRALVRRSIQRSAIRLTSSIEAGESQNPRLEMNAYGWGLSTAGPYSSVPDRIRHRTREFRRIVSSPHSLWLRTHNCCAASTRGGNLSNPQGTLIGETLPRNASG